MVKVGRTMRIPNFEQLKVDVRVQTGIDMRQIAEFYIIYNIIFIYISVHYNFFAKLGVRCASNYTLKYITFPIEAHI